jgi:hypothetical protein
VSTVAGQITGSYNLGLLAVTIGGIPIGGGAAEDGLITFENGSDLFEKTKGATGLTTYSLLNDDEVEATITVMETSRAYANLAALMLAQVAAVSTTGVLPPLPFNMLDPSTGDTISAVTAVFMARPVQNKARVAGPREFRVSLQGAGALALFGVANLI